MLRASFLRARAVFLVRRADRDQQRTVCLGFLQSPLINSMCCLLFSTLLLHRITNRKVRRDKGKKHKNPEGEMQAACVEWMDSRDIMYVASANGAYYANGAKTANSLKKRGVESGVPDLLILEMAEDLSRRGILAVELKIGSNQASEDQARWLRRARTRGHQTKVVFTLEQFKSVVLAHVYGGSAADPVEV
jgi:hypothetical protein